MRLFSKNFSTGHDRGLWRGFIASFAIHALVLGLFALGVSEGHRLAVNGDGHFDLSLDIAHHVLPKSMTVVPRGKPAHSKRARVTSNEVATLEGAKVLPQNQAAPTSSSDALAAQSTAGSSPEALATVETRYISDLTVLLNRTKEYPRESIAREQEGKVVVSVSIDRDGLVHEMVVAAPSPFRLLNEAAIATVNRIGKFPAPPVTLVSGVHGAGSLRLKIPISFRIERH
jgi:protein TonB